MPRISADHFSRILRQDARNQREGLEQNDDRSRENSEQRNPVSRADQQVKQRQRPCKKREDFPPVHQRTSASHFPPDCKETDLTEERRADPDHGAMTAAAPLHRDDAPRPAHGSEQGGGK